MAAGLEHHRAARGEQPLHQRIDVLLQQRLAAGDLDQRAADARRPRRRPRPPTSCAPRGTRTACRTTSSAGRTRSGARTRTAGPACVDSPWIEWKISLTGQHQRLSLQPCRAFYYPMSHGQADLLYEADLNDLQERQKFSGHGRRRRRPDRHQQGTAVARVPREAHRRRALPRLRQHAQPGVQGAAAAEVEEGSDRADDGEPEPDPAADPDQGVAGHLRLRQGQVRQTLTSASARRAGTTRRARAPGTASSIRRRGGRPKGFDELAFYAEHFDTVEVNSTFYGQPRAEVTRKWAERTPARLRVLGQALSEVHAPADVSRSGSPAACRRRPRTTRRCSTRSPGPTTPTSTPSAAASIRWRRRAGSARCSRSFPPASRTTPASRDYLAWLLRAFADYPVAVELRHRSWSDGIAETLRC